MYKLIMERWYREWTYQGHRFTDVRIATMELVVCHENHGLEALIVPIPDMTDTVDAMFADLVAKNTSLMK